MMLAQVSDKASDPSSWAELFKVIGFEGGLVVVFLVIGLTVIVLLGLFAYRVFGWVLGPDGWGKLLGTKWVERQDSFLSKIEEHLPVVETATRRQFDFCQTIHGPGGSANVSDLRAVGHDFAEMGRALGKATNAAGIDERADAIHRKLQAGPPIVVAEPILVQHPVVLVQRDTEQPKQNS